VNRSIASSRQVGKILAAQEWLGAATVVKPADAGRQHTPQAWRSAKISAALLLLASRLGSTSSATFARLGLGSVEAKVLLGLAEGPQRASHISETMGLDRAAVCRAVQTLARRRLVSKESANWAKALHLTSEGEQLVKQAGVIACEREERVLAAFSQEERIHLASLLGRLMINMPELDILAESRVFAAGNDQ
jgi:DNA-binding MarR family transcriptional regulator